MAKVLVPLRDKILLRPIKEEEVSKGGIALPNASRKERNLGLVLAVGKEVEHVRVGDVVVFSSYAGASVEFGEETLKLISETNIHAIETTQEDECQANPSTN